MIIISVKDKVSNIKNALIKVEKKDNKKSIENLIVLVIILIFTIIAINYIWKDDKKVNKNNQNNQISNNVVNSKNIIAEESNDNLEKRLENILSNISGVGNVKVLITYYESSVINPIYNEDNQENIIEEEDSTGGKRTTSSNSNKKEVVYSNNEIITQSVISPKIQGAVIIAQGVGDAKVKTNIIQAVEAATGLSTYKIQVFEMK